MGGKWVDASGGTYEIVNPATEEVVGHAPNATPEDAAAAAAAARDALPGWAATPPRERLDLMAKAAAAIRARAKDMVPLVIAETGATPAVGSSMQVTVASTRFARYSQDHGHISEKSLPPQVAHATPLAPGGLVNALAVRQPVGGGGVHHVLQLPAGEHGRQGGPGARNGQHRCREARAAGPARSRGARPDPRRGRLPARRREPGQSQGPEPAAALIESPDVDMVSFTGSTQIGVRIAEAGARP